LLLTAAIAIRAITNAIVFIVDSLDVDEDSFSMRLGVDAS
jgi:hypothetical protein